MKKEHFIKVFKTCFIIYLVVIVQNLKGQSPGGVGTTNLQLWLKADVGVTVSSGKVTQWNDQSGNNRNHTQATVATQPTYINFTDPFLFNHQPTLRFNNAQRLNTATTFTAGSNALYMFVVSRVANTNTYDIAYGFQVNTAANWNNGVTPGFYSGGQVNAAAKTSTKYAVTSYILPKGIAAGDPLPRIIWNGTQTSQAKKNYTVSSTPYAVGANNDGTFAFTGDIAEVIVFNATATNADIPAGDLQKIQSYLSVKYGISLDPIGQADYVSSSGTTYWTGSSNIGYQNNIIGLARDANTALYQKQATSYPDSSISVYLGTLATLNSSNNTTIASDNSFLMLGDNGLTGYNNSYVQTAPVVFQNGTSAISVSNISNKIWKTQTTTIGSWSVNFKMNKFPNAKYVLISNSPAFTPATTDIYPVVSGIASGVSVANGKYIAIGSFAPTPGGVSTGLAFWAKADDAGVVPGNSMTLWKDLSSNASDLSTVGSFTLQQGDINHNFQPWTTGYSSANYFSGTCQGVAADFNTNGNVPTISPLTVFGTARATTAAMGTITGADNEANYAAEPSFGINVAAGTVYPYMYRYTNGINTTASGSTMQAALNKSSIFTYQPPSGGGTGNLVFGLDGNQNSVASINGTSSIIGPYLHIGYSQYNTGAFSGDIQEVIWYKSILNATDINKVNSYLAIKYGVTLTPGVASNYINSAGTVLWTGDATYQKNMGGIGRDDFGALNQKQSRSVNANTNSQLTIALGTIASNNLANSNEFTQDQTSLIWGDNGITNTLPAASTVFNYNGYGNNERMNRIWKVSCNGINALTQAVTLQFPTASVGTKTLIGEGTCAKYVIIYSADPTFATGVTSSILVTNGTNYEISKKFPYGVTYFTFAKVNETPPGSVYLPYTNSSITTTDACLKASGWKYYYVDAAKTERAFAINWNGNTEPGTLNGVITYSTSPFSQFFGANIYQANIMGRLLEILPAGGSYTANGGVKVRVFFDSLELINSLVPNIVSQKWFKFSGDASATLAANNGQTILGANFLTPSAAGEEDGYDYVQFDGIQSFSTFGFASNSGQGALPLKLISLTGIGNNCNATINWKTSNEFNTDKFIIEQSTNGTQFTERKSVTARNNYVDNEYQSEVVQNSEYAYYRLKIIDINGDIHYSSIVMVKTLCDLGNSISVYPNPIGESVSVNVSLITTYRGLLNIIILNAAGEKVMVKQINVSDAVNSISIDTQKMKNGIYLLKCISIKGEQILPLQKIIK